MCLCGVAGCGCWYFVCALGMYPGNVLKYCHLIKSEKTKKIWNTSFTNKLGCLFQGIRHIKGTDTCFFIHKAQVLRHKCATYGHICCNVRPQKEDIYRTRMTIEGDCIGFPGTRAHQLPTSLQPNSSSIQQSALPMQLSTASTSQISI